CQQMYLTCNYKMNTVWNNFNFPEIDFMNTMSRCKKTYFVVFMAVRNLGFSRHRRQIPGLRVLTFEMIYLVIKGHQVTVLELVNGNPRKLWPRVGHTRWIEKHF